MTKNNHYNVGGDNPRFGSHPNHSGLKNPNLKYGQTLKKYYCSDCGKELCSYQAKRCRSCATKLQLKINNHLKKIDTSGKNNGMYGIHRFQEENPMFGKEHSEETKSKMSKKAGGTGIPYEYAKYNQTIFNNTLKESIRKRDNFTCQNCGMTEEEHLIVIGRNLDVHHIDYNKQNCKKDNLISLCQSCNIRANYNRDYWQKFYQKKVSIL